MTWTKQKALERLEKNVALKALIAVEPRLYLLIEEAKRFYSDDPGAKYMAYREFQKRAAEIVGWLSGNYNPDLCTQEAYETVQNAIILLTDYAS